MEITVTSVDGSVKINIVGIGVAYELQISEEEAETLIKVLQRSLERPGIWCVTCEECRGGWEESP